jgi:ligand-binding SRPBCC domain-containing protein
VPGEQRVVRNTALAAPAERVWERAISPEGINHELGPWLRMTMPRALRGQTIDDVPIGEPLGRSWILLLGFLPVDYDDLMLAERGPGLRFLERSTMLSMRRWQHEREVKPKGDGCEVTDQLTFELRGPLAIVPGSGRLARAIVGWLFKHRHRRLTAWFTR